MKTLALLFLIIADVAHAQIKIPKGTNTILLTGVTLDSIQFKLVDAGYFIDKRDSVFGTLVTMPKSYKSGENMIIQVRLKDSSAYFTGLSNQDVVVNNFLGATLDFRSFTPVTATGMKGSAARESFNALNKFVLSFNKPVAYLIK